MHLTRLDFCQALKNGSTNKLIIQMLSMMKDSDPNLFKLRCPGPIVMSKFNVKTGTMMSIFPTGDYKLFFEFEMENKTLVDYFEVICSLNSPNKDTFG
ncbi:CLUMA_CG018357, isoform A [Clunio marinus]|uniref:CLUMA_CG018357, isoform A n=1 Tax=Clunio marinus TaxID=568069 RepID=A0A1J1J0Z9_9DIPT|nr:CLUMA_CG018357, isoform A [Clunio marinus]